MSVPCLPTQQQSHLLTITGNIINYNASPVKKHPPMAATTATRPPRWVSHRRLLERHLSDLHKCSNTEHVKQIQAQILKSDLHHDLFVVPKLISAYSLCRHLDSALAVFQQCPNPNTHLYNSLIRAHAQNGSHFSSAFLAFSDMRCSGVVPDTFTFPFLLKACNSLSQVKTIHTHILKFDFWYDVFVPNALIDSYSKCGSEGVPSARKVFDTTPRKDIVSWNSIMAGLLRADCLREARKLFDRMPDRDMVSWNTMLDGHVKAGKMDEAFELFRQMPERNVISWSTVILGYSKKGDLEMARILFDKMPVKNLVSWTIMISGYAEKGMAREAIGLFEKMQKSGLQADNATIVSILAACSESGLLGLGEKLHEYIVKNKVKCSSQLSNAFINMYAKCGHVDRAFCVFNEMTLHDRVSWNSIIQGLAVHGHGERALELFSRMRKEGMTPDGVTFIGILCACTHVGLVEEGRRYFYRMKSEYGITPQVEHYGCMIDLLGRGGLLQEAFKLAETMPYEPSAIIWGSILSSCKKYNNVGIAEEVVDRLIKIDPSDSGVYAIMSNIYANAGCWKGMAKMRLQMKCTGLQKQAGSSLIEVDNVVHEFTVGDSLHPQSKRILKMLDRLGRHLKQAGYVPKTDFHGT